MIIEKITFIWAGIWTLDLQFYALASYPLDYWDTYTNSEKKFTLNRISIQDSRECNAILQFYFEGNPTSGYFVLKLH